MRQVTSGRKLREVVVAVAMVSLCCACSDDPAPGPVGGDTGTIPVDTGVVDGVVDAGPTDTGPADTDPTDTGALDSGPTDTGPADTGPTDTGLSETEVSLSDVPSSDVEILEDAEGDASDIKEWDTIKSDCEELGIANSWTGKFEGKIDHDVIPPDGINLIDGPIPVDGQLTFAIACIDSKFQVDGKLDGFGTAQGESYPFTLTLKGYYNPATGALNADITDGKVLILDAIEVYFAGAFNGALQVDAEGNDFFSGTWSAETTGTNVGPLIEGEAWGDGTWTANPDS